MQAQQQQHNAKWEGTSSSSAMSESRRRRRIKRLSSDVGGGVGSSGGLEFHDLQGSTTMPLKKKSSSSPSLLIALKGNLSTSKPNAALVVLPKRERNSSFKRLLRLTRMTSLSPTRNNKHKQHSSKDETNNNNNNKDSSTRSVGSAASLPDKSLLSGKGSDTQKSLIRLLSERSLVRKISQSMEHQELSIQGFGSTASFTIEDEDNNSLSSPSNTTDEPAITTTSTRRLSTATTTTRSSMIISGQQAKPIPSLHRKELIIGELLGEGGFSKVMALEGIQLMSDEEYQKRKQKHQQRCHQMSDAQGSSTITPIGADDPDLDDTSLRHQMAEQYPSPLGDADCSSPLEILQREVSSQSLVVKHLNRKLLQKPKEFHQAALDLAREAQILSIVADCPYIIKLRAMSLGYHCFG